jgi:hypothetical protein
VGGVRGGFEERGGKRHPKCVCRVCRVCRVCLVGLLARGNQPKDPSGLLSKSLQDWLAQLAVCCAAAVMLYRMAAAVAALFQDVSVRFLEERTERALQRCAADTKGEQGWLAGS